jgi:hypothetical protein
LGVLFLFEYLKMHGTTNPKLNDIIYLTAIGLTPGGSSTVHIYTKTIHRTTKLTKTIYGTTQFTN